MYCTLEQNRLTVVTVVTVFVLKTLQIKLKVTPTTFPLPKKTSEDEYEGLGRKINTIERIHRNIYNDTNGKAADSKCQHVQ